MLMSVPKLKGATLEDVPIENGATEVMICMNGNVDAVCLEREYPQAN